MLSLFPRKTADAVYGGLCWAAALLGLGALAFILATLLYKGFAGLGVRVLTETTPPPGADGGLLNAIAGSLIMSFAGMLIGTPIGVLSLIHI